MTNFLKSLFSFTFFIAITAEAFSQNQYRTDTLPAYKVISANPVYKTSPFHQFLWGKNYRREWATPIRIPVALLDTMVGGLMPTKAGGGNQTQSLQLETKAEKAYSLRSVNKTLGKVIPKEFHGTFIEDLVNDKVSMSHPYAAATVPVMAERLGIYHTKPGFVYLPKQPALDTFNKKFGNETYLFEQRIGGNWKEADNLGNFKKFYDTGELMEKMRNDNDHQVDQKAFIKARLFDMLINDWDRHEAQWEWGVVETGDLKIYKPVPKDRDQAFFKFDGVLLKLLFGVSGISYMQPFKSTMKDVTTFNYEERNLDRYLSNQMALADWQNAAKEIQNGLTDNVIEQAIATLPAEIHSISNKEIIKNLKARRDDLVKYASTYYKFISREVEIVGSEAKEHFRVRKVDGNITEVAVHKIDKAGVEIQTPFYKRSFTTGETGEIRIYGLSGNDKYTIDQSGENTTQLRIIGGIEKDNISITGKGKVHVYDNKDNDFNINSQSKMHLSEDTSINSFKYKSFLYSKKGLSPVLGFSNEDRIFAGLGYKWLSHKWRKEPFASKHSLNLNYSISERAFSAIYRGLVPNFIGNWDLNLLGNYDLVRWTNFFGLGNETQFSIKDIDFYRARTKELLGQAGLERKFGGATINFNAFFQSVKVLNDSERFISKTYSTGNPEIFKADNFAGAHARFTFHSVNDNVVPTKGISVFANAKYTHNVNDASRYVANYSGDVFLYVPLISQVSLALRGGAATLSGTPEFYQYSWIGGGQNMRGFRRSRYWGESAVYTSNELRYISDINSYLYNGKAGLVVFYDNGRVWLPGEQSDVWHSGYGAGILLAPFNKISAEVTYGISKEESLIQLRLSVPIK